MRIQLEEYKKCSTTIARQKNSTVWAWHTQNIYSGENQKQILSMSFFIFCVNFFVTTPKRKKKRTVCFPFFVW